VNVKDVNEKYRCNICGNEAIITKVGGGTLVCCGEEMELIEPKKGKKSLLEEGFEIEDGEEEEDYKEDMEDEKEEEEI
jgi:desulfoferrodoxin-like iron-binding protein